MRLSRHVAPTARDLGTCAGAWVTGPARRHDGRLGATRSSHCVGRAERAHARGKTAMSHAAGSLVGPRGGWGSRETLDFCPWFALEISCPRFADPTLGPRRSCVRTSITFSPRRGARTTHAGSLPRGKCYTRTDTGAKHQPAPFRPSRAPLLGGKRFFSWRAGLVGNHTLPRAFFFC